MFNKIKEYWASFEAWVYGWMPGFKHFIVTSLGVVGSTAAIAQQYVTNLPLDKFATATQIAMVTLGISLLALWFGNMGSRVEAREAE